MIPLSSPPTPNERALASLERDRLTGVVGVTLTLSGAPVAGLDLLFKNGSLLDPSTAYTVSGATVTLGVAAIAGDVFVALYHARRS